MIAPVGRRHQSLDWELLSRHDMTVTTQATRIKVRLGATDVLFPRAPGMVCGCRAVIETSTSILSGAK